MRTFDTIRFHEAIFRVQMADTDAGGVIYHARYFNLYNHARDLQLRDMGLPYRDIMAMNTNLSIVESRCRYIRPVFFDDLVTVRTGFTWYRSRSFGMLQKMVRTGNDPDHPVVCNEAEFIMVCTRSAGRSTAIPEPLIQAMETWNAAP